MIKNMKAFTFLLYLLIFLFPIFWLPFSFEFIEFNKIYFLLFFCSFLFLFWILGEIFKKREVKFIWNRIDFLVSFFFLFIFLSFLFSKEKIAGIFGTYGRFNDSIFAYLSFYLLYILIRNHLQGEKAKNQLLTIFWLLFFSTFLANLWTVFSLFGILKKIPKIGNFFIFSPISNSLNASALYLAAIFILVLSFTIFKQKLSFKEKLLLFSFLAISLFLILTFDVKKVWIFIFINLVLLIIFFLKSPLGKEEIQRLIFPIFVLFLALLFSFFSFRSLFYVITNKLWFPNIFVEIELNLRENFQIARKTLFSSSKNFFLGEGPATFLNSFTRFKSSKLNQGNLWAIRFNTPNNFLLEVLSSFGILAFVLFLIILLYQLFLTLFLQTDTETIHWKIFGISVFLLPIFSFFNMVLGWLFWFGLAIINSLFGGREKKISLIQSPPIALIVEILVILFIFAFLLVLALGIKFYFADYFYLKGFLESNLDKKIEFFQKAYNLNPYQPYYQLSLSKSLILKLQSEVQKQNPDPILVQNLASLSLDLARRAQKLSNQILYVENLAATYRDLINLAQGAEEWAMKIYQEAIKIDPQNPLHFVEMGKILRKKRDFEKAREYFNKALELTPNLLEAKIQLALILVDEGQNRKAIEEFEKISSEHPLASEPLFYLGSLYYNNDETEKAIEKLERAVWLSPNYSNAHFMLALCYEKKGDLEKALNELLIVEQFNPDNPLLLEKIEQIKSKLGK
jgi:tetratricopeptide (TPR) repeat protein